MLSVFLSTNNLHKTDPRKFEFSIIILSKLFQNFINNSYFHYYSFINTFVHSFINTHIFITNFSDALF